MNVFGDHMENQKKGMNYEWVVLSVTTLGVLMAVVQSSAILIALPDMMSALHLSFLTIMWVMLSYMLVTTALVPLFGRLSDMYGRKKFYVIGFAVFTFGSLLCGLAQPQYCGSDLICYRIIQGIGGALIIANSTAMVTDAFQGKSLGLGLAINGIAAATGLVIGPVIGGMLTTFGWEWIYFLNVPLGAAGTIWAFIRLREPTQKRIKENFDWWGSVTFIIGIGTLLLAISIYAFPIWSMSIIYLMFIVGIIFIGLFLWTEYSATSPMLDLKLFKKRDFTIGNTTNLLNGLARSSAVFLLIFYFQGPYGQDPLTAGLSLIPFGLSMIVIGPLSGSLSDRRGAKTLTIMGLVLTAIAMLGFSFINENTPFLILTILMIIMGAGGGLFTSPNSNSIMRSVSPKQRGTAAGTRAMLTNVGSMVGMAVAIPMVLSNIPEADMIQLFIYGGGINPDILDIFESGLHSAFFLFFLTSVLAVVIALFRTKNNAEDNLLYNDTKQSL